MAIAIYMRVDWYIITNEHHLKIEKVTANSTICVHRQVFDNIMYTFYLSHGIVSGSDLMPCFKINNPPVVNIFSNIMLRGSLNNVAFI